MPITEIVESLRDCIDREGWLVAEGTRLGQDCDLCLSSSVGLKFTSKCTMQSACVVGVFGNPGSMFSIFKVLLEGNETMVQLAETIRRIATINLEIDGAEWFIYRQYEFENAYLPGELCLCQHVLQGMADVFASGSCNCHWMQFAMKSTQNGDVDD